MLKNPIIGLLDFGHPFVVTFMRFKVLLNEGVSVKHFISEQSGDPTAVKRFCEQFLSYRLIQILMDQKKAVCRDK